MIDYHGKRTLDEFVAFVQSSGKAKPDFDEEVTKAPHTLWLPLCVFIYMGIQFIYVISFILLREN